MDALYARAVRELTSAEALASAREGGVAPWGAFSLRLAYGEVLGIYMPASDEIDVFGATMRALEERGATVVSTGTLVGGCAVYFTR